MLKLSVREYIKDEKGYKNWKFIGDTINSLTTITKAEEDKRPYVALIKTFLSQAKEIITKGLNIPDDVEFLLKVCKCGESYHVSYGIGGYIYARSKALKLEKNLFKYTVVFPVHGYGDYTEISDNELLEARKNLKEFLSIVQ